jgi:transcriptional regulator with XRE-family HTH domain
MQLGDLIEAAREAAGWTQVEVAAAAGCTPLSVRKWKNGAVPRGDYVERLRKRLPGLAALLDEKFEAAA